MLIPMVHGDVVLGDLTRWSGGENGPPAVSAIRRLKLCDRRLDGGTRNISDPPNFRAILPSTVAIDGGNRGQHIGIQDG
ncbi:hypothetical protein JUN65_04445 [Gluconacetobacter azotocaptans]|uniref:hypothetical protein n=1 Tax=Gluconacetobacter azotocaptans TaxID=142834 RepID=UPI00195B72E1|nr:hypothetical protein [Gluconacetobacter azotocaptans]MBM9400832.1 hypothetical protein [Gluconacetobacter azotocaptans]